MARRWGGVAPAKINLVLEVLGTRSDGYHELRSVMQTLSISDRISIDLDASPSVEVGGPFRGGVPADGANLAWRAAEELARAAGRDISNLRISIEKHLPAAAGVGGGASDAVTTLQLLSLAWEIDDEPLLRGCATAIGSDTAFFLAGGTALVRGRGEQVEPLPALPAHDVVLFVPPDTIDAKTAALFRALDATPFDDGSRTDAFCKRHPRPLRVCDTYNAFERVAFTEFPGLGDLKAAIERRITSEVRLAGAGPTLFWIGPPGEGEAVAVQAASLGCSVILTGIAP